MIRSPHSSTTGPPGLEPMAKDLIDDETDLSDGPFEDIIFDTPMEVVPATAATTIVTAPCPASTTGDDNGRGDLPSIEELTRHMQDLADKDVEEEVVAETRRREEVAVSRPTSRLSSVSARCPASDAARSQSPGCTEGVAVIEESSEVALPQVLEPEKEKEAEKIRKIEDRERKEALEQEILEHKIVKEVFEEKREELESIQNLQEEINKLLAPLNSSNNNSSTNVVADTPVVVPEVEKRRKEESPLLTKDSSRSSPFEICDNPKVIIEKAIIEDNQGKRERRISTDQEESSPSKCPRKSSNEVTEAIEFDAITVEEVTEELNDSVNCGNAEEGEEDEYEYEEYEEEEEEAAAAAVTAKQESIDRDEIALEKAKAREEDRKRQEELKKKNDQYSNDNMELRRALHRAGLDSSFIDSPITTNPTLFKYASSYSQKKTPEPSPAPEPAVIAKRSTTTSLVPEDNLSYSRYFSGSRYAAGKVGPSSRVSEARDQMLAMGFTDEDGWLTELITMKRGNIDQVLEVLMPVGKS